MLRLFRKDGGGDSRQGIVLAADGSGASVVVGRHGERLRLTHRARCEPRPGSSWPIAELAGGPAPVAAVLDPADYQLLLVERPDVPEPEMANAVKWRLRDRLDQSAEETVVDVFDVPPQARGTQQMIYAVAAKASAVSRLAGEIERAGLRIDVIDIPELCLRNIATALPQDRFGVALLRLDGPRGMLTLSRESQLYQIRQIEIGTASDNPADNASAIALEMQRSLDYFESHYDQRPIRDIVLAPAPGVEALVDALSGEMAVNVSALDLAEVLDMPQYMSLDEQSAYLFAIGAAMRGPDVLEQAA